MPRLINPTGWRIQALQDATTPPNHNAPLVQFSNAKDHTFSVHPISNGLVRVVHQLPSRPNGIQLRDHGRDIAWEERVGQSWTVEHDLPSHRITLTSPQALRPGNGGLKIVITYSPYMTLSWHWVRAGDDISDTAPFMQDFKKAYTYDEVSGRVWHYTCRESYMPQSEDEPTVNRRELPLPSQNRFVYGLGEAKGRLDRMGKRFVLDGRDSLAADSEETDPFYKITPFYVQYDAAADFFHGVYYNTLNPSIFDFGAEHDFSTGNFQYLSTEHAPLDYYVLLGDCNGRASPTLPSIISQFARVVTPPSRSAVGHPQSQWQASPSLPPLSQFGYLASSLTLSERSDAQKAVVSYVRETRARGFPIDGMHLSSGYCQDEQTQERHYFIWNKARYPDPRALGRVLEGDLACQVIINVKPWLLESHPLYAETARSRAFVRAAPDAMGGGADINLTSDGPRDANRCGTDGQAMTLHWSSSMGETAKGSYFDFSSRAGTAHWERLAAESCLANGITGLWIDNNEMSTLLDDGELLAGEEPFWTVPAVAVALDVCSIGSADTPAQGRGPPTADADRRIAAAAKEVSDRMCGWSGPVAVGSWGRATLTMGMARSTFRALLSARPRFRPTIVTRSAVPGMQCFAHATWSGDNATTWASFATSTRLTLSHGLSFGCGLYGHDVGGFAGSHSPSAELLVRWCQQASWHTRFTVHSWKAISTTLWMYDGHRVGNDEREDVGAILRATLAWRYALIPFLYSLYVTHYFRRGWPVLKPVLWYHRGPRDRTTLTQDEQFLVGSHLLVAPVLSKGARSVRFWLPVEHVGVGVGEDEEGADAGEHTDSGQTRVRTATAWWYDCHGQRWYGPRDGHGPTNSGSPDSEVRRERITLPAPLSRCPCLVRAGGVLALARPPRDAQTGALQPFSGTEDIAPQGGRKRRRSVILFPAPSRAYGGRATRAGTGAVGSPRRDAATGRTWQGSFTLVEDDGWSNDATGCAGAGTGAGMTEIRIRFRVVPDTDSDSDSDADAPPPTESEGAAERIEVALDLPLSGYAGSWELDVGVAPDEDQGGAPAGRKRRVVLWNDEGDQRGAIPLLQAQQGQGQGQGQARKWAVEAVAPDTDTDTIGESRARDDGARPLPRGIEWGLRVLVRVCGAGEALQT